MNKFGPKAQEKIEHVMHEFKKGDLRLGHSNAKVTNRKQALAIGISEAQKKGYKVPKNK